MAEFRFPDVKLATDLESRTPRKEPTCRSTRDGCGHKACTCAEEQRGDASDPIADGHQSSEGSFDELIKTHGVEG